MKKILIICLVLSNWANAQWKSMNRFEEFGKGNFYLFTIRDVDVKRHISEILNENNLKGDVEFKKGANLFLNVAIEDPQNSEFVYIIHCISGSKNNVSGYHVFCYYMENRYRYFYDITEPDARISVLYDPSVMDVSPNRNKKKN